MAKQSKKATAEASGEKICFVVMPFGRSEEEKRWFRGWYHEVIEKAVKKAGFTPKLGALENTPSAINDDIRKHLAEDPMIVVDLGGMKPEDEPNPNVMYELGIRHAFNLPLVLMGWKGQTLPFDINNQRAIMEERHPVDFEENREKLRLFIAEAEGGKYYRPMDAVGRTARLESAEQALDQDSVLRTLIEEVQGLRDKVEQSANPRTASLPVARSHNVRITVRGADEDVQSFAASLQILLDTTVVVQSKITGENEYDLALVSTKKITRKAMEVLAEVQRLEFLELDGWPIR